MKNASTHILDTLSSRGYRITDARTALCDTLTRATNGITIQELALKTACDEASAYRFIALLTKEELVEEITVRGEKPRYAIASHHHHHAVCTSCGMMAHLPCSDVPVHVTQVPGFREITDHEVTLYGKCAACSA